MVMKPKELNIFLQGVIRTSVKPRLSELNARVQREKAFDNRLIDRTAVIQRTGKQKCDGHHGSSEKPRLEHPSRARRTGTTPAEPVYPVTDDPEAAV